MRSLCARRRRRRGGCCDVLRLVAGLAVAVTRIQAAEIAITVDVQRPGHAVSERLYGVFFEDINFGADGGLSAELVKNGSFDLPDRLGWRELRPSAKDSAAVGEAAAVGEVGEIAWRADAPLYGENPTYVRLSAPQPGVGLVNEGYRGMGVRADQPLRFSAALRSPAGSTPELEVQLRDRGRVLASAKLAAQGSAWRVATAELTPRETVARAELALVLASPGTIDVEAVSLCPAATWKGRPHGLRADLVQALADLQPSFLRFPGGCIVEGSELRYRYPWKATVGDPRRRVPLLNRWNTEFRHRLTPDYYQSFAVGYLEYFQLCEDLGAEPLPILNCGMACQFNTGELVPLDELEPYVQDALDLIEFANGGPETPWGARRAELGHPAPFGLRMLGIGNEQWGPEYFARYRRIARAVRAAYPDIELVSGSGPFPVGARFDEAWAALRDAEVDLVDEHCYAMPDWFLKAAQRYDAYDRSGPRVFMGEYAAQSVAIASPHNRNNLRCALAEAAFLTGIERNCDLVTLSSYAPLLAHVDAWQWTPDLIWFDNLDVGLTPNYYVQQLFSVHRGDRLLDVRVEDARPIPSPAGRVGVATFETAVEVRDARVERGGQTVWALAEVDAIDDLQRSGGRWELQDGVLRQSDPRGTGETLWGDPSWSDYALSLRVRKTAGKEGVIIAIRCGDGGSHLRWILGGWGNSKHALVAHVGTHSEERPIVAETPGALETNRWYDLRVELVGEQVRCSLDGQLVHDVTIPPATRQRLFVTASLGGEDSQEVLLKAVNVDAEPAEVEVLLAGGGPAYGGRTIVLAGLPDAENRVGQPPQAAPLESPRATTGPRFRHKFPPHSLTVLRLAPEKND